MTSNDKILRKVLDHQLDLMEELKEKLKDHLTDDLKTAFTDNESFLKKLQVQEEIKQLDLEKLQRMWEGLSHNIDRMQAGLNNEIELLRKQESLNSIYNR